MDTESGIEDWGVWSPGALPPWPTEVWLCSHAASSPACILHISVLLDYPMSSFNFPFRAGHELAVWSILSVHLAKALPLPLITSYRLCLIEHSQMEEEGFNMNLRGTQFSQIISYYCLKSLSYGGNCYMIIDN